MSIFEAIRNGEYDNKLEWPSRSVGFKSEDVKARKAYREETGRLTQKFKEDLEREYGLVGHPKADLLYSKAWDIGHAYGFHEVANYYDELVELIR